MSDYMYQLESLVSQEQNELLTAVQNAAAESGIAIYLSGGAMRDMLGGFPIRDLDFTFEGQPPAKILKSLTEALPDLAVEEDPVRKTAELRSAAGATGSLRMARTEKVAKPGGTPKVTGAHLLEDLSRRDFTVNAIALSLAKASRGLIRDPMNGVSDLQNREIRVCYSQAFFDEPVRLLRAVRLRHRLAFQLEERTKRYFDTGVEEGWGSTLDAAAWNQELRLISEENESAEIIKELHSFHLLPVSVDEMNLEGLAKLETLRRTVPGRPSHWPLFLHVVTEAMKAKDRAAFASAFGLGAADLDGAKKMKPRVTKLATDLSASGLRRPSQIYNLAAGATPAELLFVLYESEQRVVQDRLRNYLEKYLPVASEITDAQVEATGAKPGTAQFQKAKTAMIAARLNAPPPPPPETPILGAPAPAPAVR